MNDAKPAPRRPPRLLITIFAILLSGAAILGLSYADVHRALRPSASRPISLRCVGVHISMTHAIYVTYKVTGHGELHTAHWRLIPFRHVDLSK